MSSVDPLGGNDAASRPKGLREARLTSDGSLLLGRVRWCDSTLSRFKGFIFRSVIKEDEGLVLVGRRESRIDSSIHMLFVFTDLGVLWLDRDGVVVDRKIARPWRPYYGSGTPAMYVLEGHPRIVDRVEIGDRIEFAPITVERDAN